MRLLLDESLPRELKRHLAPHDIQTVPEMGWASKSNGELLRLAERNFDIFLTADQKLENQQNLSQFQIAVAVFAANRNRFGDLNPLIPRFLKVADSLRPGTATVFTNKTRAPRRRRR